MFWIISGPSSIGKTTFIASARCSQITGLPSNARLLFPADEATLARNPLGAGTTGCFFHYNLLRTASLIAKISPAQLRSRALLFSEDPRWMAFLRNSASARAVILIASRRIILERVASRKTVEASLKGKVPKSYPTKYWQNLYEKIDLQAIYRAWVAELEDNSISYSFIDATDQEYRQIDASAAFALLQDKSESDGVFKGTNSANPCEREVPIPQGESAVRVAHARARPQRGD